jgi:DNA-binding MarR family transcriptional regulator
LRYRRAEKARLEGVSEIQRRTLEEFESHVLALLAQHGGQLSQVWIEAALGLPAERVAELLLAMEAKGLIKRQWSVEEYAYSVRCHS